MHGSISRNRIRPMDSSGRPGGRAHDYYLLLPLLALLLIGGWTVTRWEGQEAERELRNHLLTLSETVAAALDECDLPAPGPAHTGPPPPQGVTLEWRLAHLSKVAPQLRLRILTDHPAPTSGVSILEMPG